LSRKNQITLGGLTLVPDLSGALFIPDYQTLIIADLHLEKGSSLARRGVHVPPYDTRASLAQLQQVLDSVDPKHLVFLGDSFHDSEARERIDAGDLAELRRITAAHYTTWITGNHDPRPPEDVGGRIAEMLALGPLLLRHEPGALAEDSFEIAGHLHPAASVEQRGHRIRCRCFIGNERRIIMPAFGSYTGALSVSAEPFQMLFSEFSVWMLGSNAVHRFPGKAVR
jgi:hypothetical protein